MPGRFNIRPNDPDARKLRRELAGVPSKDTSMVDDGCVGRIVTGQHLYNNVSQVSVTTAAEVLSAERGVGKILARKAGEFSVPQGSQRVGMLLDSVPFSLLVDDVTLSE